MAAWTLPKRIADWREILTTAMDRRSRKYFLTEHSRHAAGKWPQNSALLVACGQCD